MAKIKIIDDEDKDFHIYMDELVYENQSLPTYGSKHISYYSEYSGNLEKAYGLVAIKGNVVFGFLYSKRLSGLSSGYFGMPAILICNNELNLEEIVEIRSRLKGVIEKIQNENEYKNYSNSNFQICLNSETASTFLNDDILKRAQSISVRTSHIVDLKMANGKWSKSVRTALKESQREEIHVTVRDKSHSSRIELKEGLDELRELHFEASGRQTRSTNSWQRQLESLENGNSTLVTSYKGEDPVSSALFMHSRKDTYYAVSASTKNLNVPKSHLVLAKSIEYFRENDFRLLHLGTQFSSLVKKQSSKEDGIEQFKSLFGGSIKFEFLVFFK